MMKKILLFGFVLVAFSSCRNLPDFDELSYKAIVVTNHDSAANFASYQSYFLPGSIGSIGDDPDDTILDNGVALPILNAIDANMQARGYVKENNPLLDDLALNVVTIKVTNIATMYPGWWYGWYGWYYPYYPYYPYSYTYSYSTGSLVIDIVDVKNVTPGQDRAKVLWTNFSTGVLGVYSTTALAV